ncbi:MAG: NAD(P)-dependent oxidoreductase [Alphaproteobacteria bacterium]|nr:NAD(P)-dependent oxidoreductase [Alphaproteobacteria bacterium]
MQQQVAVAFIGLGVMGEPMCRHILQKRAGAGVSEVRGFDIAGAPVARLAEQGLQAAKSPQEAVEGADLVLMSLPGDEQLKALCSGPDGLLKHVGPGQTIVDLGTSSVDLTVKLEVKFAAQGASYADAPVARTRAAAEAGTLAVLVGGATSVFDRIRPVLGCFAEEVIHCGAVGSGQVVKQMNNMVLFQTVTALAEALSIAQSCGVSGETLFGAMSKGSGNSFALHNHGRKALIPREFPKRAFSTSYALKDLNYAIELAKQADIRAPGAAATQALFEEAIQKGMGDDYFPTVIRVINEAARESGQ